MNFHIDKSLDISIYKQIVSQITQFVENGIIKPGERLPTQRQLSTGLNVARGTIQKAYEELESKGIVETIKGSGNFVSGRQDIVEGDRKETAINLIDELLEKLMELNFTAREIRAFIDIRMLERENKHNSVRIAAIDCNPEALEIFKMQISYMKNIEFRMFILDDILKYSQPDKVFEDYDIIITTLNHYDQVSGVLYSLREKLFKVAVSPSRETIINIATIPENSRIGMIVKSMNFENIILRHLKSFDIEKEKMEYAFQTDIISVKRFLKEKNILIIPQCYRLENEVLQEELQGFIKNGGKIIEFKYQIERGSLIYIEEQIGIILRSRKSLTLVH